MTSVNDGLPAARWISVAAASNLIGKRFHSDWSENDPAMLELDADAASDREAWDRAKHVQDLLRGYVTGGRVTAYAPTDDGTGVTDLPRHWVTDPVCQSAFNRDPLSARKRDPLAEMLGG